MLTFVFFLDFSRLGCKGKVNTLNRMGWTGTLLDSVVHSLYTEKIKRRRQFPLVINERDYAVSLFVNVNENIFTGRKAK